MCVVKSNIPVGGVECDLCLYVTKYLDAFLDSNSTIVRLYMLYTAVCIYAFKMSSCVTCVNWFNVYETVRISLYPAS